MAINPSAKYANIDTTDPAYPLGKARNVVVKDDGTGTPFDKDWLNDLFGFQQALLAEAGISATGTPDTATASQYLDAIQAIIASGISGVQSYSDLDALKAAEIDVGKLGVAVRYYPGGDVVQGLIYLCLTPAQYGGTPDGYIDHYDAAGNVLKLVHNGELNPKQFGALLDNSTDDTDAFQAAIDAGIQIIGGVGTAIISNLSGTACYIDGVDKLLGFKRKTGETTSNMFDGFTNFTLLNCSLDGASDSITSAATLDSQSNEIYLVSCDSAKIKGNSFVNSLRRSVRIEGTALDEAEDIEVSYNDATSGAYGAFQIRRYGRNVKVHHNKTLNVVRTSKGASSNEKPIEVSGTIDGEIYSNNVTQTNGEGGSIVVEYIDRQSENIEIHSNVCKGLAGGNGIKVGASVGISVHHNFIEDAGFSGIYIEGCYEYDVSRNIVRRSGRNSITVINDGDTAREPNNGFVSYNILEEANQDGATLGVPVTDGSSTDSYHIRCSTGGNVMIDHNRMFDSGATANGMTINADNVVVENNDFSGLGSGVIAFNNRFMNLASQTIVVRDNIGFKTCDKGKATVLSGNASVTVSPDLPPNPAGLEVVILTPRSALSDNQVYYFASDGSNVDFDINLRTSAHAAATNTGDKPFDYIADVSNVLDGCFGKTA